jgi:rod shape-determining protein MreC
VRTVQAYTAVVELIGSPGVRIAAMLEDDDRPISFQGGDNPTLGPARAVLELVPADVLASPETARRVVTSGLGGIFPARLTLGLLTRVDLGTDGLFKTGEVQLDPALSTLSEVAVLLPAPAGP